MILFIIFVIIPLIEIGLFIKVGSAIGLIDTLFLCFLTAILGAVLIRAQGLQTLLSARAAMARGAVPVTELFDGICIAVAGAMLMTPGFFTDTIGFCLLIPPLRTWLRHWLAHHFDMEISGAADPFATQRSETTVIEAEYERIDDEDKP